MEVHRLSTQYSRHPVTFNSQDFARGQFCFVNYGNGSKFVNLRGFMETTWEEAWTQHWWRRDCSSSDWVCDEMNLAAKLWRNELSGRISVELCQLTQLYTSHSLSKCNWQEFSSDCVPLISTFLLSSVWNVKCIEEIFQVLVNCF